MESGIAMKSVRNELGMTQTQLAQVLHVSFSTVSRWELGKSRPPRPLSVQLAAYARKRGVPDSCVDRMLNAVAPCNGKTERSPERSLLSAEHSSLRQIIEEAPYPIYVSDWDTDELLYLNREAETRFKAEDPAGNGAKCYVCIAHRQSPCEFCQKERLNADRFLDLESAGLRHRAFRNVRAKIIQWNGRKAQVRCLTDQAEPAEVRLQNEPENSYNERMRVRQQYIRDAFSSAHFNLTRNTVSQEACKQEGFGEAIGRRSIDELLETILGAPFSVEDERKRVDIYNREALIRQYYLGNTHIRVKHFISGRDRYYETVIDLMQNPATLDIEALASTWDITDTTMAADIVKRLLGVDYVSVMTIDARTGEVHSFIGSHADEVIAEQRAASDNAEGIACYLRKHCADEDIERVIRNTSLSRVREQLLTRNYYDVAFTTRSGEKLVYNRAVFAYLDRQHQILLCTVQDLSGIHAPESLCDDRLTAAARTIHDQTGLNLAWYDLRTKEYTGLSDYASRLGYGRVIGNVPDAFLQKGLVASSSEDEFREFYRKLTEGSAASVTVACHAPGGPFHWVSMNSHLVYDREGIAEKALISYKDIDIERENGTVYRKWKRSIAQKNPADYGLFRCNLTKGIVFDRHEGSLLCLEPADYASSVFRERVARYAANHVHPMDRNAYRDLLNPQKLLEKHKAGVNVSRLIFRERTPQGTYRLLQLTLDTISYPGGGDVELFALYERAPSI